MQGYQWYLNGDGTECTLIEQFPGTEHILVHLGNVGEALGALGEFLPWGVDVATGVEDDAYRKDPAKITAFIAAVREAETSG